MKKKKHLTKDQRILSITLVYTLCEKMMNFEIKHLKLYTK
jgi:hypothetical protein